MPTDHPDGTRSIVISRADIQMPIDVQHQTINIKTNIAETELNVPTKIAESDINVPTKIAESAINVPTNIKEQAINVKTNFKEQEVGVYAQPEWAAKIGVDKNFLVLGAAMTWHEIAEETYLVPAGKTLYINGISFRITVNTNTDYDHFLYGEVRLGLEAGAILGGIGGIGGNGITFPKPQVLSAGETMLLEVINNTSLTVSIEGYAWGYEL